MYGKTCLSRVIIIIHAMQKYNFLASDIWLVKLLFVYIFNVKFQCLSRTLLFNKVERDEANIIKPLIYSSGSSASVSFCSFNSLSICDCTATDTALAMMPYCVNRGAIAAFSSSMIVSANWW